MNRYYESLEYKLYELSERQRALTSKTKYRKGTIDEYNHATKISKKDSKQEKKINNEIAYLRNHTLLKEIESSIEHFRYMYSSSKPLLIKFPKSTQTIKTSQLHQTDEITGRIVDLTLSPSQSTNQSYKVPQSQETNQKSKTSPDASAVKSFTAATTSIQPTVESTTHFNVQSNIPHSAVDTRHILDEALKEYQKNIQSFLPRLHQQKLQFYHKKQEEIQAEKQRLVNITNALITDYNEEKEFKMIISAEKADYLKHLTFLKNKLFEIELETNQLKVHDREVTQELMNQVQLSKQKLTSLQQVLANSSSSSFSSSSAPDFSTYSHRNNRNNANSNGSGFDARELASLSSEIERTLHKMHEQKAPTASPAHVAKVSSSSAVTPITTHHTSNNQLENNNKYIDYDNYTQNHSLSSSAAPSHSVFGAAEDSPPWSLPAHTHSTPLTPTLSSHQPPQPTQIRIPAIESNGTNSLQPSPFSIAYQEFNPNHVSPSQTSASHVNNNRSADNKKSFNIPPIQTQNIDNDNDTDAGKFEFYMSPNGDSAMGKRNRDFSVPTTYRSSEVASPTSSRVILLGADNLSDASSSPTAPTASAVTATADTRAEEKSDDSSTMATLTAQDYYEIGKKLLVTSPAGLKPVALRDRSVAPTVTQATPLRTDDTNSKEGISHNASEATFTVTSPPTSLVSPCSPLPTSVTSPISPTSLDSLSEKLSNVYRNEATSPLSEAAVDATKNLTEHISSSVAPLTLAASVKKVEHENEPNTSANSDGDNYEEDFEAVDTDRSAVGVVIPPLPSTATAPTVTIPSDTIDSTEKAAISPAATSEKAVRKIPSWHVSKNLSMYEEDEDEEEDEFDVSANCAKSANSIDASASLSSASAIPTSNQEDDSNAASVISKAMAAEENSLFQTASAVDMLLKSQDSATTIFAMLKYLFYYIQQHVQREVDVCLTLTQPSNKNKFDFFNANNQNEFDGSIDYYDENDGSAAGGAGRGDAEAKTKDIKSKLLNSYRSAENILVQYNNKKYKMNNSTAASLDFHLIETSSSILQKLVDHFKKSSTATANKSFATPFKQSVKDEYVDAQLDQYNLADIAMVVMRTTQMHSDFLLPAELLNGVLTLDKLKKEYKRMGSTHMARQEMFFMMSGHMFYVISDLNMSASENIARYVTTALSLVKSPDASEISRYQRKVVKLLQSALDEQFKESLKKKSSSSAMEGSSSNRNSSSENNISTTPMSTVSTQLTPRTSFSNIKQTPISVQQQSSRKLSSAYTKTPKPSTPFIFEEDELEDDQLHVIASPPPRFKSLSPDSDDENEYSMRFD